MLQGSFDTSLTHPIALSTRVWQREREREIDVYYAYYHLPPIGRLDWWFGGDIGSGFPFAPYQSQSIRVT